MFHHRWFVLAPIVLALILAGSAAAQPPAPVRQCAEWEPVEGVMIRWPLGIPYSLVAEMSEDVIVYTIIRSWQISEASAQFESHGVNMDMVEWFDADSYSHWSRDWGPQVIFDGNGDWGIGDPCFDGYPWIPRGSGGRGWEQDDDTPMEFGAYLGEPVWQPPFYLTGGNHMNDGHGNGFCTAAQLSENDQLSEAEFRAELLDWFGIHNQQILPNYEVYGIQHIDCVAKLLDEETIVIKQVSPSHEDYEAIEVLVDIISGLTSCYGNSYEILRVDCGPFGGAGTTAYTNTLILGRKVLVPLFGCAGDAAALQVFADAMPGYEVLGFYGSWAYFDALHCRTMGIFDRGMLRVDVAPPPGEIPYGAHAVRALIDDRSEAGLINADCKLLWRLSGEPDFAEIVLAPSAAPDSFAAWISPQAPGSTIEYYVSAADCSGRQETRPIAAPEALFRTTVSEDLTAATEAEPQAAALRAWPRPFRKSLQIALLGSRSSGGETRVEIYDVSGRRVRRLALSGGAGIWDGCDDRQRELPAGLYLLRPADGAKASAVKVLKLR